ncbi:hypothetical protein M3210_02830 [Oceanobacillus luteolus]|uniref:hypothetical protein n=1 Tax=Oceanobacillus luteolus TaxID=1274358 RepID=UPI002040187B|nr:hypothetical protein [Oceanobacillus luteolus]MCM3739197.1 hypothetical protein [Oceanobacillus luteolus]
MASQYIRRYEREKKEGFSKLEAFGIIASGIAIGGTLEDLQELDRHFQKDLYKSEGLNNESTTKSISATAI